MQGRTKTFASRLLVAVMCVGASVIASRAQVVGRVVDQVIATTCAASQWARVIAVSGAATCSQPAISDVTGIYGSYYKSSNQAYTAAAAAKVLLDTAALNTGLTFDGVTNNRVTIVTAGKYRLTGQAYTTGGVVVAQSQTVSIGVNGSLIKNNTSVPGANANQGVNVSHIVSLAVNDYVELFFAGGANTTLVGQLAFMSLDIAYVGP